LDKYNFGSTRVSEKIKTPSSVEPGTCIFFSESERRGTYYLQLGEVLLPPDVVLVSRIPRSEKVIKVHDQMDKTVDVTQDEELTTWEVLSRHPAPHQH
jgi:hypothetical protein